MAATRRGERAQKALMRLFGAAQRGVYRASGGRLAAATPGRHPGAAAHHHRAHERAGAHLAARLPARRRRAGGARLRRRRAAPPGLVPQPAGAPGGDSAAGPRGAADARGGGAGAERARLWALVTARYPVYARYEGTTARQIPVVVLRPLP
jgi:hypothetical protein